MTGAIVISGPTASGKSALALELALHLNGEIISADSAQVYRGMDIGTAKPDRETRERIPHHLVDIREPAEPYSAAEFREDAIAAVRDIRSRDKVPIIAGGTMLYLKALKEGLSDLPPANDTIRQAILSEAEADGWASLHQQLAAVDPVSADRIKPGDPQRLQRALEVYRLTGIPLSAHHQQSKQPCPFPLLEIAILPPDRALLHARIETRLTEMFNDGFVDEVRALRENPQNHAALPSIRAVGYRQVWSYLDGEVDEQRMRELALFATRQLAKRQFTWLRGWKNLEQLESPDLEEALKITGRSTILG